MLLAASLEGGAPVLAGFLEEVPLGAAEVSNRLSGPWSLDEYPTGIWSHLEELRSIAALCLLRRYWMRAAGKVERAMLREISRPAREEIHALSASGNSLASTGQGVLLHDATNEPDRSGALGTHEEGYAEFEDQLVFLKNGRIVYQESEPTNFESQ